MNETKICCKCNLQLSISEYYHENGRPKGACKKCRVGINKENHKKWRQTQNGKKSLKENKKKYELKISESNRIKREEKRKEKEILLKERDMKRQQREDKKILKEKKKEGYNKLMEYYKTPEFKECKIQKEKDRQYRKWKQKWKNDEVFAMKVRLRNLIRNSFRKQGYSKFEMKTENIVGMNYYNFKEYMESMFVDGMSWDNRGEWHIDHIIPLSSASSYDELVKLCHYSNLQPFANLNL